MARTVGTRSKSPPAAGQAARGLGPHATALGALALLAAVVLAYLPAIQGGFLWDDDDYVENNLTLRTTDGLQRIWFDLDATPQYYPLVHSSYWLEYRLWGLDPTGYHLTNLLLHVAAALLLRRLLLNLGLSTAIAWGAAALFALHPVQVESVAWITERKNVLSAVFYLGAALAFLKSGPWIERERDRAFSPGWYALALLLFTCALLGKTVTASLPVALLVVIWWKRGKLVRGDLLAVTPFLALGAGFGLLTVWLEKHHVGAAGADWGLSLVDRFLVAGRALWFYAVKLVWPAKLTFIYPRWQIDSGVFWQYLFPLAAAGVVIALWLARGRIGRGPLAAVLFFALTLAPALGFLDVYPMRYSFVADHFQYLAGIGLIVLLVALILRAAQRVSGGTGRATSLLLVAALLLPAALTWRQARVYHDRETLWRDTLAKNPGAGIAHINLGGMLLERGNIAEAELHLREGIRLQPDYTQAHNNLGILLHHQGRIDEAIAAYRESLRLHPGFADAHNNLGISLASTGDLNGALEQFETAVRLHPGFVNAMRNLSTALIYLGRPDEAATQMGQAVDLDPGSAENWLLLGDAKRALGLQDEAVTAYREALRIAPAGSLAADAARSRLNPAPAPQP